MPALVVPIVVKPALNELIAQAFAVNPIRTLHVLPAYARQQEGAGA